MKYIVKGHMLISVVAEVEADSKKDAELKAEDCEFLSCVHCSLLHGKIPTDEFVIDDREDQVIEEIDEVERIMPMDPDMKAFVILDENNEVRTVVGQNLETVMVDENVEKKDIEEICDVVKGCNPGDNPYYVEEHDEKVYGNYILQNATVLGDESHPDKGMYQGSIDIPRTNKLCREEGHNNFEDWEFNLWIGVYWEKDDCAIVVLEEN